LHLSSAKDGTGINELMFDIGEKLYKQTLA